MYELASNDDDDIHYLFIRVPIYPSDNAWPIIRAPSNLFPVFLFVLSLHTCLPVPTSLALICAGVVSLIHICAIAAGVATDSSDEDLPRKVRE